MHHGQLLTHRLLSQRLRSHDREQSHENDGRPLHYLFPSGSTSIGISIHLRMENVSWIARRCSWADLTIGKLPPPSVDS